MYKQFTAIIHKEDNEYVSLCPELDIASQGETIEQAKQNLKEAVELFFQCASNEEIKQRSCKTYISENDALITHEKLMIQYQEAFEKLAS